jgi:hypothetical protein
MPWMGFEATIPASERVKTFHALDSPATVTGINQFLGLQIMLHIKISYAQKENNWWNLHILRIWKHATLSIVQYSERIEHFGD